MKNRKPNITKILAGMASMILIAGQAKAQSLLYFQDFGSIAPSTGIIAFDDIRSQSGTDVSGGTVYVQNVDWNAYRGAHAQDLDSTVNSSSGVRINNGTNIEPVQGQANVGIGASTSTTHGSLVFTLSTTITGNNPTNTVFAYTNEFALNPSSYTGLTFNFYSASNNVTTAITTNLAIEVGGTWYVSTQSGTSGLATGTGGAVLNYALNSFVLSSLTFDALNFTPGDSSTTPGGTLTIGSLTTLPAGAIQGFGVYANNNSNGTAGAAGSLYIADYSITYTTAVPEPQPVALMGLGLFALIVLIRFRRGSFEAHAS